MRVFEDLRKREGKVLLEKELRKRQTLEWDSEKMYEKIKTVYPPQ